MNYIVVVAKYKENVEWVNRAQFKNVIVYDKSGVDNGCVNVPNNGRESETFLRFIIEHYDNLPDNVVFLQGHPFDHITEPLFRLSTYEMHMENFREDIEKGITYDKVIGLAKKQIALEEVMKWVNFKKYYYDTFQMNFEGKCELHPYNQFIVPKRFIVNKPKKFWENIRNKLIKDNYGSIMMFDTKKKAHKNRNFKTYYPDKMHAYTHEYLATFLYS